MTLPKLKSAWYSNRGCFSQGLCRICWMVAGSAINRSVSVFNPIASIKTQKDICKTRLLPGEKAWPRLLRYFSQSWCWALCRISLSRLSCSLKFALVFYILLQGCLLWSPSCYVAAKFKEERRERYLLFSFAPLPFCWISRWRPPPKKIQLNISKLFIWFLFTYVKSLFRIIGWLNIIFKHHVTLWVEVNIIFSLLSHCFTLVD